ncbi:DHH family phosphoesterase [Nitratifractor sp.]
MSPLTEERWREWRIGLLELLETFPSVTVLSHVRPDPDAIGTSIGVYHLLRQMGKRVEIANHSKEIPRNLDFLPGFSKIKRKIDFADSLIVSCDCGSLDRLGFEGMEERTIVNIDHHSSNTRFGTLNIVDPDAVSSSEVAYRLFAPVVPVKEESATAFYTALISDTRYFTTNNITGETFEIARELIEGGADAAWIARQMLHRRSLASLRILGKALESLRLYEEGEVAVMTVRQEEIAAAGARASDLDGVVDYARSLVTVDVAVLVVEQKRQIKVSLRSKGRDLLPVARHFGGGGHREAAGFESDRHTVDGMVQELLNVLQEYRSSEKR